MKTNYDLIIIGGGVVGCAVAWYLSRFDLKILLMEKELDVCEGVSKANTGVIHSQSYISPGTLKGDLHQRALPWFPQIEKELDLHPLKTGALTVALSDEEVAYLRSLKEIGKYSDSAILGPGEAKKLEPAISDKVVAAYYDPHAAVVSPFHLTLAFAEGAALNGVDYLFESEVIDFSDKENKIEVHTRQGHFTASFVVNAAGLESTRLAILTGDRVPKLHGYKGEYFLLDRECQYIQHILYPVPNKMSKGILITPTLEGNILAGPNFEPSDPNDTGTTHKGLEEVKNGVKKIAPHFPFEQTIQIFSGIRPTMPQRDFFIFTSQKFPGLIHLCGIESPGLTASPGIAEYVGDILENNGMKLRQKNHFIMRHAFPVFHELSWEERENLIKQDPDWGRIICRCEEVTLAEVKHALTMNPPARTIDGLKRRVRVTAGRCQGGFCLMSLPSIMKKYLGETQGLVKSGKNSYLFAGETKKEELIDAASY